MDLIKAVAQQVAEKAHISTYTGGVVTTISGLSMEYQLELFGLAAIIVGIALQLINTFLNNNRLRKAERRAKERHEKDERRTKERHELEMKILRTKNDL